MKNSEKSAFPIQTDILNDAENDMQIIKSNPGLTKRELFALGMMIAQRINYPTGGEDILAKDALKDAYELLKQLDK